MIKKFTLQTYFICFTLLSVSTIFLKQKPNLTFLSSNNKVSQRRLSEETQLIWRKKKKESEPKFNFEQLVLTTIVVRPDEDDSNKIRFTGSSSIKTDLDDTTAVFLRNILETDEKEDGHPVFIADLVPMNEVKNMVAGKDILFCIHGYLDEPKKALEMFKKSKGEFSTYHPIQVLWPTCDIPAGKLNLKVKKSYMHDKEMTKAVGKTLATILPMITSSSSISLMAHSMGNRVVRLFAADIKVMQVGIMFRNIFMVAADVDQDIFEKQDGVNIVRMLANDGKVYVVHRKDDTALQFSARYLNGNLIDPKNRLGQFGADLSKLHSNTEGRIKNINVLDFPVVDECCNHVYHLTNCMIWLYESKFFLS